jgi:hypothetical protein
MIVCGLLLYILGPTVFPHLSVNLPQMLYLVITPTLVTLFHADNIGRLIHGTERKLGSNKAVKGRHRPQLVNPVKIVLEGFPQHGPLKLVLERLPHHGPLKTLLERLDHLV